MKKTLLTTLIVASISTAPLANELGKLKFATDSGAQAPVQKQTHVQKIVIQEKNVSQHTGETDTIPELIFDHTDMGQLAVLTPDEMAETEGAVWPVVAYMAINAVFSAGIQNGINYYQHGKFLDWRGNAYAAGAGAIGGAYTGVGKNLAAATVGKLDKVFTSGTMWANGALISSTVNAGNPFRDRNNGNIHNAIMLDPIIVHTEPSPAPYKYTPPPPSVDPKPWRRNNIFGTGKGR